MVITKESARREARERLAASIEGEREKAGAAIASAVWRIPEVAAARRILLYASTLYEVPTDEIANEARRRGIELVYPRCLPRSLDMTVHLVESLDQLLEGGSYGIREPAPQCESVSVSSIDLAFVPGLGWDRRGHRLGRGAGYYDRFFADSQWRGLRVGLFYAFQEFPRLPEDPWDMPLDMIVTEREFVRPATGDGRPEGSEGMLSHEG